MHMSTEFELKKKFNLMFPLLEFLKSQSKLLLQRSKTFSDFHSISFLLNLTKFKGEKIGKKMLFNRKRGVREKTA